VPYWTRLQEGSIVKNIAAIDLMRNDRVVINENEMPYLIDSVADLSNGDIQVTYSSGDTVTYSPNQEVTIR